MSFGWIGLDSWFPDRLADVLVVTHGGKGLGLVLDSDNLK